MENEKKSCWVPLTNVVGLYIRSESFRCNVLLACTYRIHFAGMLAGEISARS